MSEDEVDYEDYERGEEGSLAQTQPFKTHNLNRRPLDFDAVQENTTPLNLRRRENLFS